MFNSFIYNIPYILFFLPLLFSIVVCILESKEFNVFSMISTLGISAILLFVSLINMNIDSNLFVSIKNAESLIGGEFRITNMSLLFAFVLVTLHLVIFFNTNYEFIKAKKQRNIVHRKYFFMTYLLNIFSLFGLLFTSNICNYFIFLEIYSFTMYIIISDYKDREDVKNSFNYFLNSICGSIIVLLSIFCLCIFFNSNKMIYIVQRFLTTNLLSNITLLFIVVLFFIGLTLKFYSLDTVFYKSKSNREARNLLSFLVLFINSPLSMYSILYFAKYLFNIDNILTMLPIKATLILAGTGIICYSCYQIIKDFSLQNFVLKNNNIYIGFVLISLCLNAKYSTYLALLFIFEHIIVNFIIYLFYNYLAEIYRKGNISLNDDIISKFLFFFIMGVKIFLPIGVMYHINSTVLFNLIGSDKYILLLSLLLTKITYVVFTLKNASILRISTESIENEMIKNDHGIVTRKVGILEYTLTFMLIVLIMSTFIMKYLKVVFYS